MAYYAVVTGVQRSGLTGMRVEYELRNDATAPHAVIEKRSMVVTFLRDDAKQNGPGQGPDKLLTAAERTEWCCAQVAEELESLVRRARATDADYAAAAQRMEGERWPKI